MTHRILWFVLVGAGVLGTNPEDASIARIESGLLPPVAMSGAPTIGWTLSERMNHYRTPGVSVAVVRGARIAWRKGYGVLEAGRPAPVDSKTLFQAASISKPVAAAAALAEVERRTFALDEDVNRNLKSWRVPPHAFDPTATITLRRLLSNSAGLTVHGFRGYATGEPVPSLVEILDGVKPANSAPIRVDVCPGTVWRYSGGGYTVLQQLMIDATGTEFAALVRSRVLQPIGMRRSTYEQPLPEALRASAARGHRDDGTVVKGLWHTYPEMAAAGLWITPTELAQFAIELREAAAGRSGKVLSRSMAETMLTVQKGEWGLGVKIEGAGRSSRFSHGGANEGYRSFFVMYRDSGDGAVIMTNGDLGDRLFLELLRAIATEYDWPDFRQQRKTVAPVSVDVLRRYEGNYDLQGDKLRFRVEDSSLWLDLSWRPNVRLYPESPVRFFATEENVPSVTFIPDAAGAIAEVELMGRRARRVP